MSDLKYCIKLKGVIHDNKLKCCDQALLVCNFYRSDVKAKPGYTGDIIAVNSAWGSVSACSVSCSSPTVVWVYSL